ncbi:MAG: PucR family transcriptional regulator [Lacisediminihabitans sp.]
MRRRLTIPATLRHLLDNTELGLTLLTPKLPTELLGAEVSWVHSSDLLDPTPFLSAGQVLLTTGTHFPSGPSPSDFYWKYVWQLRARGISALGFGTDVIRDGTPEDLIRACQEQELPLFEVPYRTPFIALIRLVADIIAEDSYARDGWALRAQRAISLAAIRPDGLSATLAELSSQLGSWVALFDAAGSLDRVFPVEAIDGPEIKAVQGDVARLLRNGQRSSATVSSGGETLTLQTLGAHGRLRGALAIGGTSVRDQASEQVVTSVIALASLALEQNHALDRARGHLRSGLMHMLLNGETELVDGISAQMWGALPAAPIRLVIADAPADGLDAIVEYLELRAEGKPSAVFYAVVDDAVALCVQAAAMPIVDAFAREFGVKAGASAPAGYDELRHAWHQAEIALDEAKNAKDAAGSILRFESLSHRGLLAFVTGEDARELGSAILKPLIDHDNAAASSLLTSVRVWLTLGGQFEAAAHELGVHRHTLRARIAQAEQLLGRDLGSFQVRAEVWAAILATANEAAATKTLPG